MYDNFEMAGADKSRHLILELNRIVQDAQERLNAANGGYAKNTSVLDKAELKKTIEQRDEKIQKLENEVSTA